MTMFNSEFEAQQHADKIPGATVEADEPFRLYDGTERVTYGVRLEDGSRWWLTSTLTVVEDPKPADPLANSDFYSGRMGWN